MANTIRLTYKNSEDASYSPCAFCGEYIWPSEQRLHKDGACAETKSADTIPEDMRLVVPRD